MATGLLLPVALPPLPKETVPEQPMAETWATELPLTSRPVALHRAALDARGVLPVATLEGVPTGRKVAVAG